MIELKRVIRIAAIAGVVGLMSMGGCSSSSESAGTSASGQAGNFDFSQCKRLEENLYKCPAFDMNVCTPDYKGTEATCVRVGSKGSVFVQKGS